jgi:hypothetical protein
VAKGLLIGLIQQFSIAFWAPSLKLVVKEYNISLHERFERKRLEFGEVNSMMMDFEAVEAKKSAWRKSILRQYTIQC